MHHKEMESHSQQRDRDGTSRSNTSLPKISIPTRWNSDAPNKQKQQEKQDKQPQPQSSQQQQQQQQQSQEKQPQKQHQQHQDKPTKPSKDPHRHHLHRRHHRHHHTRDTIQSAIQLQNPFSFENPLRRTHHAYRDQPASNPTANPSRASLDTTDPQTAADEAQAVEREAQAIRPLQKIVHPSDIAKEKRRCEHRAQEVSTALGALSKDAHTATRKLDDTYYALLERLATLRSLIASLQDLSAQAQDARREWAEDVGAAGEEVEGKLEGFDGFKGQEENVEGLVDRLDGGREKMKGLEERLEGCRERLERIQKREEEERKRAGRWWMVVWASLGVVVVLVLVVVVWRQKHGHDGGLLGELTGKGGDFVGGMAGFTSKSVKNKTVPGLKLVDSKVELLRKKEEEKWNRVLDEL